jgi:hypothetical protein
VLIKANLMKACAFIFLSVLLSAVSAKAQKQLILLKRESVQVRKLKNKEKREGKILELNETQIITSNDTLLIGSIESLYVKGKRKVNVTRGIGGLLFIGGIGYFAIDQVNRLIVKGADEFDEQVALTSLAMTATGAAILFIHSPYKKVYGHTLKTIDYTSRFYKLP